MSFFSSILFFLSIGVFDKGSTISVSFFEIILALLVTLSYLKQTSIYQNLILAFDTLEMRSLIFLPVKLAIVKYCIKFMSILLRHIKTAVRK